MAGLTVKTMKLAPDLVAQVEAHRVAHGLASWTAAAVDLMGRGLAGPKGAAVLDALPKAEPAPSVPKAGRSGQAKAQTKAPPPVKARVHVEVGGPVRPAPGSRLKRR